MKKPVQIALTVLRIVIGVGLLTYLVRSGALNLNAMLGLAAAWRLTILAFLVVLLDAVFLAWRLCILMRAHGLHLTLGASARLTLIGVFFNSCLPGSTGGDLVKIYYATEGNRGRRAEITTVMLLDRAVGMFALLLLPILVAPFFPDLFRSQAVLRQLLWITILVAAGMLLGTLLCFSSRVRNLPFLQRAFERLPGGVYGRRIFDTVHSYRQNPGALLLGVGISLFTHVLAAIATWLAGFATIGVRIGWEAGFLIPLGHLANTLPLTPGGLGVGEAAFNTLFALAGSGGGAEALLGWRVVSLMVGLIGLVLYLQGRRRFVHAESSVGAVAGPSAN
jgi:uncharacterized protein (TIRG00374 family)